MESFSAVSGAPTPKMMPANQLDAAISGFDTDGLKICCLGAGKV
jgi:hypothetical protein